MTYHRYQHPLIEEALCEFGSKPARERDATLGEKLGTDLQMAFAAEPLEDGMPHPAEDMIREALQLADQWDVLNSLRAVVLDSDSSSFAASVLRCLGRQPFPGVPSWRADFVQSALASNSLELRDAAAQAAEQWGDSAMREVLEGHSEPVRWLRDYILEVIQDISHRQA